jgi:hypothetical protein
MIAPVHAEDRAVRSLRLRPTTPEHEAAEAEAWLNARKPTLHTYREGQDYWTDVGANRNPRFLAGKYGRGRTREEATISAELLCVQEHGPG